MLVLEERTGQVVRALDGSGAAVHTWERFAVGGRAATAWPPEVRVDLVALRMPKARAALVMMVHAAAARLAPKGRLVLAGANDEGARSAGKTLAGVFGSVTKLGSRRHCQLWEARDPLPDIRGDRASWAERVDADGLSWSSWPGLFAHGRLDAGTALLLDVLPTPAAGARVLDFGCGAGVLGIALRARQPAVDYTGIDVDALAVAAARDNLPGTRIVLSDAFLGHGDGGYDLVVSNPPLHTGVARDVRPLADLLAGLPSRLTRDGEAWLVTQRGVDLAAGLGDGFRQVERVRTARGFRVWRAWKPR